MRRVLPASRGRTGGKPAGPAAAAGQTKAGKRPPGGGSEVRRYGLTTRALAMASQDAAERKEETQEAGGGCQLRRCLMAAWGGQVEAERRADNKSRATETQAAPDGTSLTSGKPLWARGSRRPLPRGRPRRSRARRLRGEGLRRVGPGVLQFGAQAKAVDGEESKTARAGYGEKLGSGRPGCCVAASACLLR